MSLRHLYTMHKILKSIRALTDNQCNSLKHSIGLSYLPFCITILAAIFCTLCNLLSTKWVDYVGEPMKYQVLRPQFFSVGGIGTENQIFILRTPAAINYFHQILKN